MKTLYFDTNYLFRLYSTERGAVAVQELANQTESIAIAWHGRTELASILLRKHRGVSVNKLLDEFSTQGLVEFDLRRAKTPGCTRRRIFQKGQRKRGRCGTPIECDEWLYGIYSRNEF